MAGGICGREATIFHSLVDGEIEANGRHKKNPKRGYAPGVRSLLPHFRLLGWAAGVGGHRGAARLGLINAT